MAGANDVIAAARSKLGYYAPDDPEPGSFCGRWLARKWNEGWLAGPSTEIWWCCLFVSWCLDQAGQECPGFPTYNTDLAWKNGASTRAIDKGDVDFGDILIFDWNWATPATDHIGFALSRPKGGYVSTIEGNVGNRVAYKTRPLSSVRYALRPPYDGTEPVPVQAPPTQGNPDPGALEVDGWLGNLSVTKWQRALKTGCYDGVVSGQWYPNRGFFPRLTSVTWEGDGESAFAATLQHRIGATADGIVGPATVRALQAHLNASGYGLEVDGVLGQLTAKAAQDSLNKSLW